MSETKYLNTLILIGIIMKHEPNGIRKEVEKVMKGNGWIYPSEIANKIKKPFMEVYNALKELERDGLVEQRKN